MNFDAKVDNHSEADNFAELNSLNLAYTDILDADIALLTKLTKLTYLSVDSRLITDAGLDHLSVLTDLHSLDLFGCKVLRVASSAPYCLRWCACH